jgi:ABC-type transport system substrate-binding protein
MRLISLIALMVIVLALTACGGEEPKLQTQPPSPPPGAIEPEQQPEPETAKAAKLLDQPKETLTPEKPVSARVDHIAEARRCLADGDTEGYQTALKSYNEILKRDGGGLTVVAVTATSVTWRTEDGNEYTTNLWHDALTD